MRHHDMTLDDGPNPETVLLRVYPDGIDSDRSPGAGVLAVTLIEAEGDTAPQPAEPVTVRFYRDGTFSLEVPR